jgi:hypothetical protein
MWIGRLRSQPSVGRSGENDADSRMGLVESVSGVGRIYRRQVIGKRRRVSRTALSTSWTQLALPPVLHQT